MVLKMNKEELESRTLCAKCNKVKCCSECVPNNRCKEWTNYLDNPNSRLGRLLCYLGIHDWYKYRSSNLMKCKRCCKVREQYRKIDLEYLMVWRLLTGRLY